MRKRLLKYPHQQQQRQQQQPSPPFSSRVAEIGALCGNAVRAFGARMKSSTQKEEKKRADKGKKEGGEEEEEEGKVRHGKKGGTGGADR